MKGRVGVLPVEREREMAWRCPNCGRSFRHHVFSPGTPASGPVCNTCCVALEWGTVEAEKNEIKMALKMGSLFG